MLHEHADKKWFQLMEIWLDFLLLLIIDAFVNTIFITHKGNEKNIPSVSVPVVNINLHRSGEITNKSKLTAHQYLKLRADSLNFLKRSEYVGQPGESTEPTQNKPRVLAPADCWDYWDCHSHTAALNTSDTSGTRLRGFSGAKKSSPFKISPMFWRKTQMHWLSECTHKNLMHGSALHLYSITHSCS